MHIPADNGVWVDENFERLARIIKDFYGDALELRYIPPANRTNEDTRPYAIVDIRTNSAVMYATELDTPQEILTKLFEGDTSKHDVLANLDAHNEAAKAFQMREWLDRQEEANDKALFLIKSPLHKIRMDGMTFDSDYGRTS